MAEVETDDIERKAAAEQPQSRGVALADETPDELPALLAIAVGVAILAITIVWPSIRDRETVVTKAPAEEVAVVEEAEVEEEPEEVAEEPVAAPGPDLPLFQSELAALGFAGLGLSADGNIVTATGVVPDEAGREQVLAYLAGQPNVESVIDELTIEPPAPAGPDVTVEASQTAIVLTGTVQDEATREALVARAVAVYSAEQVTDELIVDPGLEPPAEVTIRGSVSDPVLYNQVITAFDGIEGVEVTDLAVTQAELTDLETSLGTLEPIQFASGSALIEPASEPILDEAATYFLASPDIPIEIGGHTDSRGGEESNKALSQARADSVLAALQARGVTNPLTATGYGELRLKVSPDDNDAEAQRMNRRIEFYKTN